MPPVDASPAQDLAVIVLSAGGGTRMRSALAKPLHTFAGRSILAHVLAATDELRPAETVVVVGHQREQVVAHLADVAPHARTAVQDPQLGTADAVRHGLDALDRPVGSVLVVTGDTPALTGPTLSALVAQHRDTGAAAGLLTARVPDPTGYGRVLRGPGGDVDRVVEHRDATSAELAVDEIATGIYVFSAAALTDALARVGNDNAQGEYYLPDVIGLLRADDLPVSALTADAQETAGVNDRAQLAAVHRTVNARLLRQHMLDGVRVVDPATTWVDVDVVLAADCEIRPGCTLSAGTSVAAGAIVGPDCDLAASTIGADARVSRSVLDHAEVGPGAAVGPYAYLRPGARLRDGSKAGTFVELKNAEVGRGSKVPHLSYVGDATIGERSNIGAATIFVNYDGRTKSRSEVGDDVRIGADNTLVAPVRVGDGAYTGAGAVVRHDVPSGAISFNDMGQKIVEDWVAHRRPPEPPEDDAVSIAARNERGAERRRDERSREEQENTP